MNTAILIGLGLVGLGAGYWLCLLRLSSNKQNAKHEANTIIARARQEVKELEDKRIDQRHELKRRLNERELTAKERLERLNQRLQILEKQAQKWDDRLVNLSEKQTDIKNSWQANTRRAREKSEEQLTELLKKTGVKEEEALSEIENKYLNEFQRDYAKLLQKTEYFAKEDAVKTAQRILVGIMNRYSEPSSVDRLDNTVTIRQDRIKGVLIGKEGRNINYFEEKAGVAVIFNDQSPKQVTISCFHLLRREIARIAVKKLCKKRAINEAVIDSALEQARKEMDVELEKVGRWAAKIIDLPKDKWSPEFLRLIGRLKYRTSYGQNILYHSLEIAFFSSMMAAEIGADTEIARLGGFFHDLGKAIDQDDGVDKPHDHISKDLLEEFGFSWEIVHAAWTHHDAIPIETIEAELVKASDAISAGRPGARAESAESYYERLAALEKMAKARKGVKKVYAMSAGRELRLFMNPKEIKDEDMPEIAADLAHEIEETLSYPGKVKVNLVRRLEAVDYAKEK